MLSSDEVLTLQNIPSADDVGVAAGVAIDIVVTRGTTSKRVLAAYTYHDDAVGTELPVVSRVDPGRIHPDGGWELTLSGQHLTEDSAVFFVWTDPDGAVIETEASVVSVESDVDGDRLVAMSPEHPEAWIDVVVQSPQGLRSAPGYPVQIAASAVPPNAPVDPGPNPDGNGDACTSSLAPSGGATWALLLVVAGLLRRSEGRR